MRETCTRNTLQNLECRNNKFNVKKTVTEFKQKYYDVFIAPDHHFMVFWHNAIEWGLHEVLLYVGTEVKHEALI